MFRELEIIMPIASYTTKRIPKPSIEMTKSNHGKYRVFSFQYPLLFWNLSLIFLACARPTERFLFKSEMMGLLCDFHLKPNKFKSLRENFDLSVWADRCEATVKDVEETFLRVSNFFLDAEEGGIVMEKTDPKLYAVYKSYRRPTKEVLKVKVKEEPGVEPSLSSDSMPELVVDSNEMDDMMHMKKMIAHLDSIRAQGIEHTHLLENLLEVVGHLNNAINDMRADAEGVVETVDVGKEPSNTPNENGSGSSEKSEYTEVTLHDVHFEEPVEERAPKSASTKSKNLSAFWILILSVAFAVIFDHVAKYTIEATPDLISALESFADSATANAKTAKMD